MLNHSRLAAVAAIATALTALVACSSSGAPAGPATASAAGTTTPAGSTPGARTTAATFPVTVHGANGDVAIPDKPTAIVSLSPTATETLFAIGAGTQVKAVDKNSTYPADAPRTSLSAYQVNIEAIANYHPDLVVTSGLTPKEAAKIASLHVPVLDEPAAGTLDDAYAEIVALGTATGHPDAAARLVANMKQQIAGIVAATPKTHASYYWELTQDLYSETSATFIGQLLRLLGLTSIADAAKGAAASGGYPQLSAEYILQTNPGYVFLADTKCCQQSPATVAKRAGWSTLGAVRDNRVVALDDDIASRWGPRIVDLLRTVATAIQQHPAPAAQ